MKTYKYLRSITDREFRLSENTRILINEPLEKFISLAHSSYPSIAKEKYAQFIISQFKPLKFESNSGMFDGSHDFIVDKNSGYAFFNLGGQHAYLMRILYALYQPTESNNDFTFKDITEVRHARRFAIDLDDVNQYHINYIDENYGYFLSSSMTQRKAMFISIGENYILTENENKILDKFVFDRI